MSGTDYTLTPNFGLYLPTIDADDGAWGVHLNQNSTTLDAQLIKYALLSGATFTGPVTLAADPAAPMEAATQRWVEARIDAIGSPIISGDTPPVGADDNTLWWDSAGLTLYYRYNDGNSSQWVSTNVGLSAQYLPIYYTATGGTTPRSAYDRAGDVANVLDYGADPTGATDSTPAFAAALALRRNGRPVDVYAPAGVYYLSAPITVGDTTYAQRLSGDGWSTILTVGPDFPASANGVILVNSGNAQTAQPAICDLQVAFRQPPDFTTTTTATTAAGGTTLTLADVSGIRVGCYCFNQSSTGSLRQQVLMPKVTDITGNVVTIDQATLLTINAGHTIAFSPNRSQMVTLTLPPTLNPGDPGIKYPWAIYNQAQSVFIDHVLVSGAWNGVYIRGQTFAIGQLFVGAMNIGLDIDACYNFPKLEHYQLWNGWGISAAMVGVYYDGATVAANIGRCDDFAADLIQSWCGIVNITSAWSWGTINQLNLDGDNANLNVAPTGSGWLHVGQLYSTTGQHSIGVPITITGPCRVSVSSMLLFLAQNNPSITMNNGSLEIGSGHMWNGLVGSNYMISVTGGDLSIEQMRFDSASGRTTTYLNQTAGTVRVSNSVFITPPGAGGRAFALIDAALNTITNVELNGWAFNAPGPLGRYEERRATSVTYSNTSSWFRDPDTVTSGQLVVSPTSVLAAEGKLRLYGAFASGADSGPRLSASFRSGYTSAGWTSPYLNLWLGNGSANDAASDANTSRVVNVTLGGMVVGTGTGATILGVSGAASALRAVQFQTAGSPRFNLTLANNESTGNAGSDIRFTRFDDSGAQIDSPFLITRSTGTVTISQGASFGSAAGASNTDLSKHVALYGTSFGFAITANRQNYVAPAGATHGFIVNSADRFSVSDTLATVTVPLAVGATGGPTIRAGTGAATGTQPSGSLWLRTDGSAGARLYVSQGGGTWVPVASV